MDFPSFFFFKKKKDDPRCGDPRHCCGLWIFFFLIFFIYYLFYKWGYFDNFLFLKLWFNETSDWKWLTYRIPILQIFKRHYERHDNNVKFLLTFFKICFLIFIYLFLCFLKFGCHPSEDPYANIKWRNL